MNTFGAEPFFVYDPVPLVDVRNGDGNPIVLEQSAAFGQCGAVMVELVLPGRAEPGRLGDLMSKPGFNHVAYFSTNTELEVRRLESIGAPVIASLDFGGVRVHFHDALNTAGVLVEHYPCVDAVEATYRRIAEAARDWDGNNPIRGPLA